MIAPCAGVLRSVMRDAGGVDHAGAATVIADALIFARRGAGAFANTGHASIPLSRKIATSARQFSHTIITHHRGGTPECAKQQESRRLRRPVGDRSSFPRFATAGRSGEPAVHG